MFAFCNRQLEAHGAERQTKAAHIMNRLSANILEKQIPPEWYYKKKMDMHKSEHLVV